MLYKYDFINDLQINSNSLILKTANHLKFDACHYLKGFITNKYCYMCC